MSNEPEFTVEKLTYEDRLLILASDGVWATVSVPLVVLVFFHSHALSGCVLYQVSAKQAADILMEKIINLSSYYDAISPAEYLVQEAVNRGSGKKLNQLKLKMVEPINDPTLTKSKVMTKQL